jgi:hypothetical protein
MIKNKSDDCRAGGSMWFEPVDSKYSIVGVFEGLSKVEERTLTLKDDGYQTMMARSITRFGSSVTPPPKGAVKGRPSSSRTKRPRKNKQAQKLGETWGDSSTVAAAQKLMKELFPEAFQGEERVTKLTMDFRGKDPFVVYIQTNTRYCNSRKGYHQSNHAYFQLTLTRLTMRCHDKDCRVAITKRTPHDSTWSDQIFIDYDSIPVSHFDILSTTMPTNWAELKSMPLARKKFIVRILKNAASRSDKETLNRKNPFFLHRLDKLIEALKS